MKLLKFMWIGLLAVGCTSQPKSDDRTPSSRQDVCAANATMYAQAAAMKQMSDKEFNKLVFEAPVLTAVNSSNLSLIYSVKASEKPQPGAGVGVGFTKFTTYKVVLSTSACNLLVPVESQEVW